MFRLQGEVDDGAAVALANIGDSVARLRNGVVGYWEIFDGPPIVCPVPIGEVD